MCHVLHVCTSIASISTIVSVPKYLIISQQTNQMNINKMDMYTDCTAITLQYISTKWICIFITIHLYWLHFHNNTSLLIALSQQYIFTDCTFKTIYLYWLYVENNTPLLILCTFKPLHLFWLWFCLTSCSSLVRALMCQPRFDSWHVPLRDSYYKGEPDHDAGTHHVFVYYVHMVSKQCKSTSCT